MGMGKAITLAAVIFTCVNWSCPALAAPVDVATAAVTTWLDKFNAGDTKAFLAAHEDNALIVDEFGQYLWSGPGAAQRWLDEFMKESAADGITAAHMDYGKPLQANSDGAAAYIVLPTTYRFEAKGKKMAGKGSMTFVMHKAADGWKIASWTYSGAAPVAE
jgi:ketosteroid isomerase-like protein